MKSKTLSKTLLSAVLTIALALSMIGGATYALFTSKSAVNVAITSGTVQVSATPKNLELYSPTLIDYNTSEIVDPANKASGTVFANGGTATLNGSTLTLSKIAPGDRVSFDIDFSNQSNIATKYRFTMTSSGDLALVSGLSISLQKGSGEMKSYTRIVKYISEWADLPVSTTEIETQHVKVELPATQGDEYQNRTCVLNFAIEAVQANTKVENVPGTTDGAYVEYLTPVFTGQQLREGVTAVGEGESGAFVFGQDIKTAALSEQIIDGKKYGDLFIKNKNISLDLGGYTLTMSNTYGQCATLKENATLTVKNGTLAATRAASYNYLFFVGGQTTNNESNNYVDSLNLENLTVDYTTNTEKVTDGWASLIGSNATNAYAQSNVSVNKVDFNVSGPMEAAFYLPNRGTRSFIDSSVAGSRVSTSFFIVGGDWNIQGGSFVGNKYELGAKCEAIQDKILANTDSIWQGNVTIAGTNYKEGIVGYHNGAFGTGDAICIVVRYEEKKERQGYLLGDITIEGVSFTMGTAELSDEDKTSAAIGAVLSGPSGYAVRIYDAIPKAARGAISVSVKDSMITAPMQIIKGESGNTEKKLHGISLYEKKSDGSATDANGTSIKRDARV